MTRQDMIPLLRCFHSSVKADLGSWRNSKVTRVQELADGILIFRAQFDKSLCTFGLCYDQCEYFTPSRLFNWVKLIKSLDAMESLKDIVVLLFIEETLEKTINRAHQELHRRNGVPDWHQEPKVIDLGIY